jgi:hypothetical protein
MQQLTPAQRSTVGVAQQVEELLSWFEYKQLPAALQERSKLFNELARQVTEGRVWSDQTVICLLDLLRAKDAGVRALIQEQRLKAQSGG